MTYEEALELLIPDEVDDELVDEYQEAINTLRKAINFANYQLLASRTINTELDDTQKEYHALHGMIGELGEINSIYQKHYQGHEFNPFRVKSELGDLMWFVAEYCSACGWTLEDVCQHNIEKLKARYPEGFSTNKSLHRAEGDL